MRACISETLRLIYQTTRCHIIECSHFRSDVCGNSRICCPNSLTTPSQRHVATKPLTDCNRNTIGVRTDGQTFGKKRVIRLASGGLAVSFLLLFLHWHFSPLWVLACRTISFFFLCSTFVTISFLLCGVVSPTPNPNLEDQGIPFCLGHHP
jgi:hypothetical protein